MSQNIIFGIAIFICIALSAFFSAVETAFSTVNTVRMKHYAKSGNKQAINVVYIIENFDRALTATLIMNNVVNLSASSIATVLCVDLFGNIGAAISTGVTTFLILTFAEITPKCVAKENSENIALKSALILKFFMFILTPLIFFFVQVKTLALKLAKIQNTDPSVTEAELKYIIESIEEQGVLEEEESEMVQLALDFDDKMVQEILTPRVDLTAIDIDAKDEVNKNIIMTERFSRIPVYKDSIDNIVGILHTRDYLEKCLKYDFPNIKQLLQPAYFIYKTRDLSFALADFKKNKLHIAIVTDEYGGTLGIVTMEDLLEEIVGEIWDEDEEIESMYTTLNENEYLVNGEMELDDLLDLFKTDSSKFKNHSITTVGGFIADKFGKIPKSGESFTIEGLTFTADNVLDQRIINAIVKKDNSKKSKNNKAESKEKNN